MTSLIISLISGAAGGNVAGKLLQKFSLGTLGNSIVGILGGGIGGQLLSMFGVNLADAGSMDVGSIVSSLASGGAGGGVLMTVIGLVKNMMAKK